MNDMKNNYPSIQKTAWSLKSQREQRAEFNADMARTEKHIWYCELIISACVGASLTLIGVIIHMMVSGPEWTW